MKFCDNCGAQIDGGARFCTYCGERLCPAENAAPSVAEAEMKTQEAASAPESPEMMDKKTKPRRKGLIIGGIITAVVLFAAALLLWGGGDKKPNEPVKPAAPAESAGPAEPTGATEPGETGAPIPDENSPYAWWNGEWYGWWTVTNSTGSYSDWEGNYWDAYAIIEEYGSSGYMQLWDEDYSYEAPLAGISLSFAPGEGSRGVATAEAGYFMDADISQGSIISDPDADSFGIEDMIFIDYTYVDPADPANTLEAYIFLRPWGHDWEDVQDGGGENWPYGDMMPMYFYEWYLPLIRHDQTLPHSHQEGRDILSGASRVGSGEVIARDEWSDCRIDVVGAEHFVDWEGKDAIRVYYDFTNTSDDLSCAADIVAANVSQDEYEQHNTSAGWLTAVDEENNAYLSVCPGVTIRCAAEYRMKLSGGNIVFEFCSYWDENESFTVEFDPQKLPGRPPKWEEEFVSDPQWTLGLPEAGNVGDYYVSLDHVEIVEGYEFNEVFKVVLNFTNNSDTAISFSWGPGYKAFQNGIELSAASPSYDFETEADYMLYEEVRPGQSAQVAVCYALRNEQSPVEFEVFDYWTGDRIGNTYELTWGG